MRGGNCERMGEAENKIWKEGGVRSRESTCWGERDLKRWKEEKGGKYLWGGTKLSVRCSERGDSRRG